MLFHVVLNHRMGSLCNVVSGFVTHTRSGQHQVTEYKFTGHISKEGTNLK